MDNLPELDLEAFSYHLPEEKIAQYPLEKREESKLLVYGQGGIQHRVFKDIQQYLPRESLLFFNDTKVIPARLFFQKQTGAVIEVFLLHPVAPVKDINEAMQVKSACSWQCMVGNFKKWKEDQTLEQVIDCGGKPVRLQAKIKDRDTTVIGFEWDQPEVHFVDLIEAFGKVPLPPYINRETNDNDLPRYQTVYSQHEGAVAAPTAGLHFNELLLRQLEENGHLLDYLTLHVGAGTFQPVKEKNMVDHPMHCEQLCVSRRNLENLYNHGSPVIAIGTTSMRTLESIYWYGVKLLKGMGDNFQVSKLLAYEFDPEDLPEKKEAVKAVIEQMESIRADTLFGETEMMIFPGYQFKICEGLVTNYHLPGSTLMLLVAAFIGEDWRKVYQEALENDYRFLSYGDSSLLLPR